MTVAYVCDLDTLTSTSRIFAQPRSRMLLASLGRYDGPAGEAQVQQVYHSIVPHDPYLAYLLAQLRGKKYMFTNDTRVHYSILNERDQQAIDHARLLFITNTATD
jgi:hypothetical protein